jgi:hypothetical protein
MVAMGTCKKKGGEGDDCSGSNFCSYYPYQPKKPYLEALALKLFDFYIFACIFLMVVFSVIVPLEMSPNKRKSAEQANRAHQGHDTAVPDSESTV